MLKKLIERVPLFPDNALMKEGTRKPLTAGIFYPAEKEELRELIKGGIDALESTKNMVDPDKIEKLIGLILPHAAYEFILPFLLEGFELLRRKEHAPDTIILAAGLHREKRRGIFLPPFDSFSSPLGEVPVDTDSVKLIQETVDESYTEELPYLEEHSFEVLLPLISLYFPRASIVPVLTGNNENRTVSAFSRTLRLMEHDETLLIISSNTTGETDPAHAELQKNAFFDALRGSSARGEHEGGPRKAEFMRLVSEGRITACGAAAPAGLMQNCPDLSAVPLQTGTSRRGNEPREVIYGTIALTKRATE